VRTLTIGPHLVGFYAVVNDEAVSSQSGICPFPYRAQELPRSVLGSVASSRYLQVALPKAPRL